MKERTLINSRIAVEKGLLPDEAVTVGQLSGGEGIAIYQSDGRYIDCDGIPAYDINGRNNIVVNRNKERINLTLGSDSMLYSYLPMYDLRKKYGSLIRNSTVFVNNVGYNQAWFSIQTGTDDYGNEKTAIIHWQGRFQLESTDDLYWEI